MNGKYNIFTRANVSDLRDILYTAVEDTAKRYGLKIQVGQISYTPESATIKLNVVIDSPDLANFSSNTAIYASNVKTHGWKFGVNESMLGKIIKLTNGPARFVGCTTRSSKYCLIFELLSNGKLLKATRSTLSQLKSV